MFVPSLSNATFASCAEQLAGRALSTPEKPVSVRMFLTVGSQGRLCPSCPVFVSLCALAGAGVPVFC